MHPCKLIYQLSGVNIHYGATPGTCRITGEASAGLPFAKWVRDTFTDHSFLKPGNIISNEALFCFDEASEYLQQRTGREKLQRFRTYSHIVADGVWHVCTKADKEKIFRLLTKSQPEIVCLSESGQKHLLFKNRPGLWQLEETTDIPADVESLKIIHATAQQLMQSGFSQTEIISGNYPTYKILKAGLAAWQAPEAVLKTYRFTKIFDLGTWMLFLPQP